MKMNEMINEYHLRYIVYPLV